MSRLADSAVAPRAELTAARTKVVGAEEVAVVKPAPAAQPTPGLPDPVALGKDISPGAEVLGALSGRDQECCERELERDEGGSGEDQRLELEVLQHEKGAVMRLAVDPRAPATSRRCH